MYYERDGNASHGLEKIFAHHSSDTEPVFTTYKEPAKVTNGKIKQPTKNGDS